MIQALIDPSCLSPPAGGADLQWLSQLRAWARTLREIDSTVVRPVMSSNSQAALAELASRSKIQAALDRAGSPWMATDVLRLIESIRGRARTPNEAFQPSEVIPGVIAIDPDYVDSGSSDLIQTFNDDLAHSATFSQETSERVAVITTPVAWKAAADRVGVKTTVEAWERFGITEEPSATEASVSEYIDLWVTPRGADATLSQCWTGLIDFPQIGIEVAYRGFTPADQEEAAPLKFEISPKFVESMEAMGYKGQAARIKAVYKAAAYISCRRQGDLKSLEPHAYGKGGPSGSPIRRESDGAKLMRGKLGTGPNAHRLMWWASDVPELLGVVGHDDDPRSLT
jgi:hypothetical protein